MTDSRMDKQFWLDIRETNFALPPEQSVEPLTEELFSYLEHTDPDLRDLIAYETFSNWLEQGLYSSSELRAYILRLILNLQNGLGERDTDTVFARTFSALFLAEIVHYDNKHPFLDKDEVLNILAKGLNYLEEEMDPRGYVPEKGWAHALAHTADLLYVLASNRFLARENLEQILKQIAVKLTAPTDWVYIHGEDDRLVRAVIAVYQRHLVSQDWLAIITPDGNNGWKDSFMDLSLQNAFFNSKTFLRSLYLRILQTEELASEDNILESIQQSLQVLRQF
jgi:Protein of unknown function (DUF2785)